MESRLLPLLNISIQGTALVVRDSDVFQHLNSTVILKKLEVGSHINCVTYGLM